MAITNQQYDEFKINRLKHFLDEMHSKGQPRQFEIFVDSLKVVPRTEDINQFEHYEQYMDEDTQKVRILIYNSSLSPRNDQYCYFLPTAKNDKQSNGLGEIDTIIQERLAARDREHELDTLRQELRQTKEHLEESERETDDLRIELEDIKSGKKRQYFNGVELVSGIVEGFLRRNPHILGKIPGGAALAGLIENDNQEKAQSLPAQPEPEAVFQKKEEPAASLSTAQLRYIDSLRLLEETFAQPDLDMVMAIIAKFSEQPALLPLVNDFIHTQNPNT